MFNGLKVDRNLLLDILSDGIDWSCARGYWGQVDKFDWTKFYEDFHNNIIHPSITDTTVLCSIRDDEDGMAEEENRPFTPITLSDLNEATKWALVSYNHLFPSFHTSKGIIDEIDYDAIGADVILQKIVLGDVVYG